MLAGFLEAIGKLDGALFQQLRELHAPFFDVVMYSLSEAARGAILWIVAGLLLGCFQPKRWPAVWQLLLALGLATLLTNTIAKPMAGRHRPFETYAETRVVGPKPTSSSLPSGHVTNAVAAAYALTRVAPGGRVVFWTLALLVAYSRIYLGVHYPLDVIAGAIVGLAAAAFVIGGSRWDDA